MPTRACSAASPRAGSAPLLLLVSSKLCSRVPRAGARRQRRAWSGQAERGRERTCESNRTFLSLTRTSRVGDCVAPSLFSPLVECDFFSKCLRPSSEGGESPKNRNPASSPQHLSSPTHPSSSRQRSEHRRMREHRAPEAKRGRRRRASSHQSNNVDRVETARHSS